MPVVLPRSQVDFRTLHFRPDPQPVILFTDGSASPPDMANMRVSSWAVVAAHQSGGNLSPLCAGITPGPFHDISGAETFAVLACMEHTMSCHMHFDNQGVVSMLQRILASQFDPFTFRTHPNYDLWLRISQLLLSRPPGLVSVSKIKAHRDENEIQSELDKWLAKGNDQADHVAKQVLREHAQTKTLDA